MRKNIFVRLPLLIAAFALFFLCTNLQAQYENGSLTGTIRDSSGATIPGATVKLTNNGTSNVSETKTNATGDYEFPSLRVGVYSISASAPSFSDAVAQNITVSVGNRQHIDLTLKVGTTETTVEVTDVALQIETETSERGQNITNYQSESLPLVSRNYSDFLALIPGSRQAPTAALTSSVNSLLRAGSFNVNGQRSMFNNYLLDGLDNNAYGESNQGFDNQIIAVPPDSVAQFQVVTNNESAEYGRASGATINVASQSGTNNFHATLYEFIRNTDLNAAGFFKPLVVGGSGITTPFKKPTFNRNQFGVNFGGPIIKDKLFFFLDYEGFRQVLKPLSVLTLPTQNELYGGVSGSIANPTPVLVVPVKNATTGVVYAAGTPIPTNAINPVSLQIIKDFAPIASALPASGLATTGLASNDYSVRCPSRITPTRAICGLTGRSTPRVRRSSAPATARKTASTIRPSPFRWTARPMAISAFSTSRSRSATRIFSAPTESWTCVLASTAPRPASITSRSETPLSITSPAFLPTIR